MKKKNLKNLNLNKKSISHLSDSLTGGNKSIENSCIASCISYTCPPPPPVTFPTQCNTCQAHTYCGPGHCISEA